MSVWRLVFREIRYRKLSFGLAVLSAAAAVGCLVAVLTLLRLHDLRTEQLVADKETKAGLQWSKLQDEYRKLMLQLGFNIQILPKDQNLGDLYAADYAARTMPEEYADRLASAGVLTINHILPSLEQRITWPEQKRTVILVGIRGELPIARKGAKKPLLEKVLPGAVFVGHELHESLKLRVGDQLPLFGREFRIRKLMQKTGTRDDIKLWVNLAEAQRLLGKEGQINEILALECNCDKADRLGDVSREVAKILPDTQVIEKAPPALVRAEVRQHAARGEKEAAARERQVRSELRQKRVEFAGILIPLVVLVCTVGVGLLAFSNVRERSGEIGILRALGVGSLRVFGLFLTRAVLAGLLGALLGYAAGLLVGLRWGDEATDAAAMAFEPALLASAAVATPLVCALASWVPALVAARRDPAVVLREG